MPIVSTDDLSLYQSGDAQTAIDEATAIVRGYCGWHITPVKQETITLDGPGGSVLVLPSLRVTAIASVVEDGTALVEGTDYDWSATGYLTRLCASWTCKKRAVAVTLTHGFDEVPDVARVILAMASRGQDSPGGLVVRRQAGPFSESYGQDESEASTLDRYRLPRLA